MNLRPEGEGEMRQTCSMTVIGISGERHGYVFLENRPLEAGRQVKSWLDERNRKISAATCVLRSR